MVMILQADFAATKERGRNGVVCSGEDRACWEEEDEAEVALPLSESERVRLLMSLSLPVFLTVGEGTGAGGGAVRELVRERREAKERGTTAREGVVHSCSGGGSAHATSAAAESYDMTQSLRLLAKEGAELLQRLPSEQAARLTRRLASARRSPSPVARALRAQATEVAGLCEQGPQRQ